MNYSSPSPPFHYTVLFPTFSLIPRWGFFFFSLRLCLYPPPLSPPFLSVRVGLWLPYTKNSFCHLRSSHARLHRCHNTGAHTQTQGNSVQQYETMCAHLRRPHFARLTVLEYRNSLCLELRKFESHKR